MDEAGAVRGYLHEHGLDLLERLAGWVRIPSVFGEPEDSHHLLRSANWLAGEMREAGFPTVEVWPSDGTAAVFAQWCAAPGAPTVLVYSHHDVRAVKDGNWAQCAPFEPVLRDGRLYGRGSSDAKGQVMAHMWGVRAHLAATGRAAPAVNLKFLVEGEEEAGSAGLAGLLEQNRDRLEADLVVFSDTLLWQADHPAICTSVRGMLGARLEVQGPLRDVHSGAASGPAPNPAFELSRLLARLHDERGRIALPGFYDTVEEISARRRAELAALPFDERDWLARSQTRSVGGEESYSVLERLWERPAVEVIALAAGDPEGLTRASIPAVASAKLSIRTTAGQRADEVAAQLREWVAQSIDPRFGHDLAVDLETAQEPYRTPDHPALEALERAMRGGFVKPEVGRMGNAGGGPAQLLASRLGVAVLFFGTGLIEDLWHDSDESVHVDTLISGTATLALLWQELAEG
jgi:acetylornithine deacetylase/succinyl-diaminopimelate desuccinylase-like protein